MDRCKLFHTDSVFCGISALAMKTNAPTVLKREALSGAKGSSNNKVAEGYSRTFGNSE
jgi:2-methylcitrate dehydratase